MRCGAWENEAACRAVIPDRRLYCCESGTSFCKAKHHLRQQTSYRRYIVFYSASTMAATIFVAVATYSAMLNFFTTSTS